MKFFVVVLASACSALVFAQSFDQRMEAYVEVLVAKHGTGTDKALRAQLLRMGEEDQAVRGPGDESEAFVRRQESADARLTTELKRIVAKKGWPTIALVGYQASEAAALVLMHSRDHDFQRAMLPRLEELAENGKILRSSVAMLVDKILVSEGKRQRFGTQFRWANGTGEMLPVEDMALLDERRAKYMLPPMAEYKKMVPEMYRVKID